MICPLYEVISPPPRTHLDTHTRDKRMGSQSLLFPCRKVHEAWVKEGDISHTTTHVLFACGMFEFRSGIFCDSSLCLRVVLSFFLLPRRPDCRSSVTFFPLPFFILPKILRILPYIICSQNIPCTRRRWELTERGGGCG